MVPRKPEQVVKLLAFFFMSRSSSGQDSRFSFWQQGFDPPTGYQINSITMITITPEAKQYLDKVRNDDYVTLGVKGGGCSGFTYVWDFKKNWPDVDWSEPYEDALVLDPMAEMFVAGCTIDYKNELGGSYLTVINPNATASCGCGESFAV